MYKNLDELYGSLQKTREKLFPVIENLPPEKQNWRENGEGWTIKEIAEHLSLVEAGIIKIIQKLLGKAKSNSPAAAPVFSLPADFGEKLLGIRDRKLQAPEFFHPQGNQSLANSLEKLKSERRILEGLRAEIESVDASAPVFPHPALGDLNAYQWIVVVGLHESRHLMQIERILQGN